MITYCKLLAAAFVFAICASTSGVMAQQPPPTILRVVDVHGDFSHLIANLANTFGVTVGLELDTERYQTVKVSLQDATLTDVMNATVQSSKRYQWRQSGAFVEVWPLAGSNSLLDTRINTFNVKDVTPSEAFDRLFSLPEVQANMTTLNLKRRAPEVTATKLSSSKLSVNLEGVSLREALDRIAQEARLDIWVFRNYPNGSFSISTVDR